MSFAEIILSGLVLVVAVVASHFWGAPRVELLRISPPKHPRVRRRR